MKNIGLIAIVMLIGAAGTVSYINFMKIDNGDPVVETNQHVKKLPASVPEPIKEIDKDRTRIVGEIKAFAKKNGGVFGVYVYETDTKISYGMNQNKIFIAASTNKIPTLIKVYKDIEAGKLKKSTKLTKTSSDYETGTGILQGAANGSSYTVKYLTEISVSRSDNIAHNMLIRTVGRSKVQTMLDGMKLDIDMYKNTATPKGMGVLLAKLYEDKLISSANRKELMSFMYKTAFENRLPKYIKGAKVHHKIGTRGTISDVGVVGLKDRPYIISIYVSGLSEPAAEEAIAKLSKLIFDYEKSL